jgi:DNA-binding Lrp family transcriptional regulator
MNQKDLSILSHLRKDSRIPLTKMSKNTQIPVSTIFDKIKAYEKSIIMRHTTLIDFQKLGYSTRANISIKVERGDRENVKKYLIANQMINSVYKINNGFDFMLEGIFKDIKDMEDFIEILEAKFKVVDHKSFFIIEDLKRESFMSEPDLVY